MNVVLRYVGRSMHARFLTLQLILYKFWWYDGGAKGKKRKQSNIIIYMVKMWSILLIPFNIYLFCMMKLHMQKINVSQSFMQFNSSLL